MLEKAHTRGSDALIVDFEDAVVQSEKPRAREIFSKWLETCDIEQEIWVRINADDIETDLLVADHKKVTGLVIPKATLAGMNFVSNNINHVSQLSALIEGSGSLLSAQEIAKVSKTTFLQIGQLDLRAELGLGIDEDSPTLDHALSLLVLASAAAGINQPIAPIYRDFNDEAGLRASCKIFKSRGFFGRTCVHPRQIGAINEEFSTSQEELSNAQSILASLAPSSGVGVDENGMMIDEAAAKIARRIIDRNTINGRNC